MPSMDMRAEITNITCPTLVIGGTLDPVTPTVCSEVITDSIGKNVCLHMFEDGDMDRIETIQMALKKLCAAFLLPRPKYIL